MPLSPDELPRIGGIARQFSAVDLADRLARTATPPAAARAAEAERRLAIYARRVYALERGLKLAPGQASAGLEQARDLRMDAVELREYVEGLYGKLAALERRLLAAEEGRSSVTRNLPAVTSGRDERHAERDERDVTHDAERDAPRDAAAERARRYRERKKAKREGGD